MCGHQLGLGDIVLVLASEHVFKVNLLTISSSGKKIDTCSEMKSDM